MATVINRWWASLNSFAQPYYYQFGCWLAAVDNVKSTINTTNNTHDDDGE